VDLYGSVVSIQASSVLLRTVAVPALVLTLLGVTPQTAPQSNAPQLRAIEPGRRDDGGKP
jgi:hypothetical protein